MSTASSPSSPRPWTALYREGQPAAGAPEHEHALAMFAASVARAPDVHALRYFDGSLTVAELDAASDAFACGLLEAGFAPGDRLALFVQNDPAFLIGLLAAWKAGGVAVAVNPMYKARELRHLLRDSGASVLLCLDDLHDAVVAGVVAAGGTRVRTVVTVSALDGQTRDDPRVFAGTVRRRVPGTTDLYGLLGRYAGRVPPPVAPTGADPAFLVYTSGTTGEPKAAVITHANLVFNARTFRDWVDLQPGEGILAVAPLFHITGLVGHAMLSLLVPAPLVLTHRFAGEVVLDAVREHSPTFTVGAITAFTALAGTPGADPEALACLTKTWSGGAAIAPAVADKLEVQLGHYVRNAYGLTETSSATHLVPTGRRAPVDPVSGALSIGVPVPGTDARVLDDDGRELPPGQVGELVISGPQVAAGYWGKPAETEASMPGGELRTGDVAFMDEAGWFYLVDRKKDMINASGYKVWPREVEDVLYSHPAVREAAVVGVPDAYRGETVQAYVSLEPGSTVTADELVAHCSAELAAYKYPRSIVLVEELPKTVTGKILRRELRRVASPG